MIIPNPALTGQSSFLNGCIDCGAPTAHPEDRAILRCEYHARAIMVADGVLMAANEPAQATKPQTGQNVQPARMGVNGSGPARWVHTDEDILEGFR